MTSFVTSLLLLSSLLLASAQTAPPLVTGLSYTFHDTNYPTLEIIIRDYLTEVFSNDIGQAAGLLRIHFHDCFVQGCDASVLLVAVLCPNTTATGTTVLDLQSPNVFDNGYYVDLMNRQGLFVSDQDLFTNTTTRPIVTSFAINQTLFFEQFVFSVVKMGMMNVTTGTQGEIRANCSQPNSAATSSYLKTLVEEAISEVF